MVSNRNRSFLALLLSSTAVNVAGAELYACFYSDTDAYQGTDICQDGEPVETCQGAEGATCSVDSTGTCLTLENGVYASYYVLAVNDCPDTLPEPPQTKTDTTSEVSIGQQSTPSASANYYSPSTLTMAATIALAGSGLLLS